MKIVTNTVRPNMPEFLLPLQELAGNLWLSWNFDAVMLFIRLDYDAWIASQQNPAKMLGLVSQKRLEEMAFDDSFLAALNEVYGRFNKYIADETWYSGPRTNSIAYFSMEYGLDISLPIYSGGLGVLSGDHMKTSSDLGLPLVGIGLLYRQGYFRQYLNADGFQQESYPENDWYTMPVSQCKSATGEPVRISVEMAGSLVVAQLWEVKVGRSSLYLLDTNIPENSGEYRNITSALYGGDKENRIRQEILLGIGGLRAIQALGIASAATHMNEGHAAFLALERILTLMTEKKLSFEEARQTVWSTNIFTTHTPVPAGNERFSIALMEKYFKGWAHNLGLAWKDFLGLGRENPDNDQEEFCMTILALKLSAYANGVSRLHGEVSRDMWQGIWPGLPKNEIPVTHITNGVHPRSWINHSMLELMDRYFGPRFNDEPTDLTIWDRMDRISDEELWRTHERRRERLVFFVRQQLKRQMTRRGSTEAQLAMTDDALSPYALTVSFARRFATYKRGDLLFRDPDRLIRLLSDRDRPLQLIFAGKAHPHDLPGKEIIRAINHFTRRPEVRSRIVFLEDYDMAIARYLTSGSDVWLNTPRRPLEASGTSGMKAAMNGIINVSVLDGWWDEAFTPAIGWAIGHGETYVDQTMQDAIESEALYDLLEREIIPQFYNRGRDNLPREWIRRMKGSMQTTGRMFSSHRMLLEYSQKFYLPAMRNHESMAADSYAQARNLASYTARLRSHWSSVRVFNVQCSGAPVVKIGDALTIGADVELAGLKPEEVCVELFYGPFTGTEEIAEPVRLELRPGAAKGTALSYSIEITCERTGRMGYSVRVLPKHPALVHPFLPGLVKWGE